MIGMLANVIALTVYVIVIGIFVIAALQEPSLDSPCNIPEDCGNCMFPCEKHKKKGKKK